MAKAVKGAEKAQPADAVEEAPQLPRPPWMTVAGWLAAVFSVLCMIVVSTVWVRQQELRTRTRPRKSASSPRLRWTR